MNTVMLILIIALIVIVVIAAVIALISIKPKSKGTSDIHFLDGADVKSGRLSADNNYFKGFSGSLKDTVVINENFNRASGRVISIKNISGGSIKRIAVAGELTMGREAEYTVYDKSASRMHCKIISADGKLFLADLNSSNHTYLNGNIISDTVSLSPGDVIRIGKTELEIKY